MAWSILASRWLAQSALGGLIVLAMGSLAVRACRQPARRVRLVVLVLLGGLAVPWIGAIPGAPRWRAGLWPAPRGEGTLERTTPGPVIALGRLEDRRPRLAVEVSATPARTVPTAEAAGTLRPARGWFAPISWRAAIVAAYAAIAAGLAAWWLLGQALLWRLARAARPVPPPVRDGFLAVTGPAGARVQLLESDRVALPFTFTWTRPVILVPRALCRGADLRALRFCLAHEWSHVERGDIRAWNLASLAGLAMFYQPLYWWLRRELRLCQDYLADDRAAELDTAEEYAAFLVRLAREGPVPSSLPALGVGDRRSNLHRRILMLINEREPWERRCRTSWSAAAAVLAAAVTLSAAALRLDAASAPDRDQEPKAAATIKGGRTYACRVVDQQTGRPIAGASVLVRLSVFAHRKNGGIRTVEETRTTTDAEGGYRLIITPEQAADPALYVYIDVNKPGYLKMYGGYGYEMIVKNETLGARPFFEIVELRPGRAIEARLVDPRGKPVAGVRVNAFGRAPKAKHEGYGSGAFTWTTSGADGRFRLDLFPAGPAVFWICPKDYALSTHVLKNDRRGDLGTITLETGNTIRGRVLDARGKPVAGVYVSAGRDRTKELEEIEALRSVADDVRRSVVTDAAGAFTIPALPAGHYTVQPDEQGWDPATRHDVENRARRPLPGLFVAHKVILNDGETDPITIRGIPHVVVEARIVNSKGEKARGYEQDLTGTIDGAYWGTRVEPTPEGLYRFFAPHGLENAQISLSTNEHRVLRHRVAKDRPLSEDRSIWLGTLDHDVKSVEIVDYVAPVLVVKVATKDGTPPPDAVVWALYAKGEERGKMNLKGGVESDCDFNVQADGRFRSEQLFPDREVTLFARAEGYAPKSATYTLAEGSTQDVELILDKE